MTAQNDAKTIQAAYDAFGRGDLDAVASAFAPDIVWHEAGQSPSPAPTRVVMPCSGYSGGYSS